MDWKPMSLNKPLYLQYIQNYYSYRYYVLMFHHIYHKHLLSLIHISEPTRRTPISYAVFCLKKKKKFFFFFFFLMIRRPPRSTPLYSSAASDVYKRQLLFL